MPSAKQPHQETADHFVLTHENLADFTLDRRAELMQPLVCGCLADIVRHRGSLHEVG